jgi:hypothetical protein
MLIRDELWALELKHKYPFGPDNGPFSFGINDGQLEVLSRLDACGIHCVRLILANPRWLPEIGSGYLTDDAPCPGEEAQRRQPRRDPQAPSASLTAAYLDGRGG